MVVNYWRLQLCVTVFYNLFLLANYSSFQTQVKYHPFGNRCLPQGSGSVQYVLLLVAVNLTWAFHVPGAASSNEGDVVVFPFYRRGARSRTLLVHIFPELIPLLPPRSPIVLMLCCLKGQLPPCLGS